MGTTRLALHVARQTRASSPAGRWLAGLDELTQADLLPATIRAAMTGARHGPASRTQIAATLNVER